MSLNIYYVFYVYLYTYLSIRAYIYIDKYVLWWKLWFCLCGPSPVDVAWRFFSGTLPSVGQYSAYGNAKTRSPQASSDPLQWNVDIRVKVSHFCLHNEGKADFLVHRRASGKDLPWALREATSEKRICTSPKYWSMPSDTFLWHVWVITRLPEG